MDKGSELRLLLLAVLNFFINIAESTKKASCNGWTLTAPEEGSFGCNPAGSAISMPGTRCTLHCDTGYRAEHEVLVCSETGGWIPTNTPECQADSTMTLVIVLSIVGSIIVIFGLSLLYARYSKRCRGKRRNIEDDDVEAGSKRREVNDTSTYYGQVKRLRRKRRLQAERQKKMAEAKRRNDGTTDRSPSKNPTNRPKKGTRNVRKRATKGVRSSKARPRGREMLKMKSTSSKKSPPKQATSKKVVRKGRGATREGRSDRSKINKNRTFQDRFNEIFCLFCKPKVKNSNYSKNDRREVVEIKPRAERGSKRRKDSTSSSSSSSSSSDSSSDEPPRKETKKETPKKDTVTPQSRATKKVQKPAVEAKKKPPPRPPAPILPTRARRESTDTPLSSDDDERNRKVNSSGYSSEGGKQKRKRGQSEPGVPHNSTQKEAVTRPHSAAGSSSAKRMEMMSPGEDPPGQHTTGGNPYENYPAALSYRQYHDFENDYRRTTGDYHPQYCNVKVIPLEIVKKKEEASDKETGDGDIDKKEKSKPIKGGVKYIGISEEGDVDEDSDEPTSKRNRRKRAERYEDPSDRDKRRKSPDYHKRHQGKDKKHRSKSPSKKRDRKKEIEGERIIDEGKVKKDDKNDKDDKNKKTKRSKRTEKARG